MYPVVWHPPPHHPVSLATHHPTAVVGVSIPAKALATWEGEVKGTKTQMSIGLSYLLKTLLILSGLNSFFGVIFQVRFQVSWCKF